IGADVSERSEGLRIADCGLRKEKECAAGAAAGEEEETGKGGAEALSAIRYPQSAIPPPQSAIRNPQSAISLALCPGAEYGPAKRWLPERFAEVARVVCEKYPASKWLLFGVEKDREIGAEIERALG